MACDVRAKPAELEACPLCHFVLGKPRREFTKQVGRHMEEIALMALPRDVDEVSDAESVESADSISSRLSSRRQDAGTHTTENVDFRCPHGISRCASGPRSKKWYYPTWYAGDRQCG